MQSTDLIDKSQPVEMIGGPNEADIRVLTPDGFRVIRAGPDNDPEKPARFRNEGIVE